MLQVVPPHQPKYVYNTFLVICTHFSVLLSPVIEMTITTSIYENLRAVAVTVFLNSDW